MFLLMPGSFSQKNIVEKTILIMSFIDYDEQRTQVLSNYHLENPQPGTSH